MIEFDKHESRAVLDAVTRIAVAGKPCPTNGALAKEAGIKEVKKIAPILNKLALPRKGYIKVTTATNPRRRIIKILKGEHEGASTA